MFEMNLSEPELTEFNNSLIQQIPVQTNKLQLQLTPSFTVFPLDELVGRFKIGYPHVGTISFERLIPAVELEAFLLAINGVFIFDLFLDIECSK